MFNDQSRYLTFIETDCEMLVNQWREIDPKSQQVSLPINMTPEDELYSKLNELKQTIPKREWRYYHLLAIDNFIYHLRSIKNERSRIRTADGIGNLLQLVSTKLNDNSRLIDKGKALAPSVWQLSDIYRYEVGFIAKPDFFIMSIVGVCLFFLLQISFNALQSLIITVIICSVYSFYAYLKTRARKVY